MKKYLAKGNIFDFRRALILKPRSELEETYCSTLILRKSNQNSNGINK